MKFVGFERRETTFYAILVNKEATRCEQPFIQFTRKNPWFVPHKEIWRYEKGYIWIAGWLFIYFGKIVTIKN